MSRPAPLLTINIPTDVAQSYGPMILYIASFSPHASNLYRTKALERLGERVLCLNTQDFRPGNPLLRKLLVRAPFGPWIDHLNQEILSLAQTHKPEIVWADKALWLRPETLQILRQHQITTVSYVMDNPFGTRNDPGWHLHLKTIPYYDLHVVQRDSNILDYQRRGARHILKIQTAYEPSIHFPPEPLWTDQDRNREISFIGSPYDNRVATLTRLAAIDLPITMSGNPAAWKKALDPASFARLFREGELLGVRYRQAIWRSKINLSFLTHANQDEFAHKSFEIAACGGFLLAERSQGHSDRFIEDEEAVFFSTFDELRAKILQYLPNAPARARIAAAGHRRATRSGYDNDTQVARILADARKIANST